ncbi:type II toxin-antitoxin system RelE/ParE family toxin [Streptomyces monomycini]|uniref:type II toxin-antitoxin system RelE/ParE family toxin n=1 Tax=Streptomyces monomycini TaxID=371720 RepID=UPI0004ABCF62|nr:type II toxin-antitoxin system RelE/ParE family toxin [Streptomyces monomycini]
MPKNRRRALVTFHETAERQLAALADDDLARLDPVLDAIADAPDIGRPLRDSPLREYQQNSVRVIYYATTLGTIIVVAYVEV